MAQRLLILIDMRASEEEAFLSFRETISSHCGELFTMAFLAHTPVLVSFHLLYLRSSETILDNVPLHHDDFGLPHILKQLMRLPTETFRKNHVKDVQIHSNSTIVSQIHRLCSVENDGDGFHSTILFATSFLTYSECFCLFTNFTIDASYEFHCISAHSASIYIGSCRMGAQGWLHWCLPDPYSVKALLQVVLEKPLLRVVPVPVFLKIGSLSVWCEARRTYLSVLPRSTTMESLTHVRGREADLVFDGLRLVHSHVDRSRARGVEGPVSLDVEALMDHRAVDETCLYGDTWVLSAAAPPLPNARDHGSPAPTPLKLVYDCFKADVLVCSSASANFGPPHQLAPQRACVLVYFLDRSRMLLRQIIPSEIRRAFMPSPQHLLKEDAAPAKQLTDIRGYLLERSRHGDFCFDNLTQGNVCQVVSDLETVQKYRVELFRILR